MSCVNNYRFSQAHSERSQSCQSWPRCTNPSPGWVTGWDPRIHQHQATRHLLKLHLTAHLGNASLKHSLPSLFHDHEVSIANRGKIKCFCWFIFPSHWSKTFPENHISIKVLHLELIAIRSLESWNTGQYENLIWGGKDLWKQARSIYKDTLITCSRRDRMKAALGHSQRQK